jgi:glycosyltransferase involved in cell wall biosynthesis
MADRVHFLGERSDIPSLLGAADVFVLSSITEGISVALLEAMSMARPVVVTAAGGNTELVKHGQTGLLALPSDPRSLAEAILHLLRNPHEAHTMGIAAREFVVQHYDVRVVTSQLTNLYLKVLGRV